MQNGPADAILEENGQGDQLKFCMVAERYTKGESLGKMKVPNALCCLMWCLPREAEGQLQ